MDKIRTLVINEGTLIKDDVETIELTNDYIELIPKNKFARYLKLNIVFKNYRNTTGVPVPVIIINGVKCPIQIQTDFEINVNAEIVIESLMINRECYVGHIMFIECDSYLKE